MLVQRRWLVFAFKFYAAAFLWCVAIALVMLMPFVKAEDIIKGGVQYQYQEPTDTLHGQVQQDELEPGVVGLEFAIKKLANAKVRDVYPGTPAFYAGLMPGDEILTIDGKSTKGLSVAQVDQAISDQPGDMVEFMVSRQGKLAMKTIVVMPVSSLMSAQLRNKYVTAIFASNLNQIEDLTGR